MSSDELDQTEKNRIRRTWDGLTAEQKRLLTAAADQVFAAESIRRGFFICRAPGFEFEVILN